MKKQFNLNIVILSLISIVALQSCSDLELEATDSVIQDVSFTGLADSEASLAGFILLYLGNVRRPSKFLCFK